MCKWKEMSNNHGFRDHQQEKVFIQIFEVFTAPKVRLARSKRLTLVRHLLNSPHILPGSCYSEK